MKKCLKNPSNIQEDNTLCGQEEIVSNENNKKYSDDILLNVKTYNKEDDRIILETYDNSTKMIEKIEETLKSENEDFQEKFDDVNGVIETVEGIEDPIKKEILKRRIRKILAGEQLSEEEIIESEVQCDIKEVLLSPKKETKKRGRPRKILDLV